MTVVAIDGPAGSGKSTVARAVGAALGLAVLETGAMYRAVTWAVLREGIDPAAGTDVALLASKLRIEAAERVLVDGEDVTDAIRAPEVTAAVSLVAAHAELREILVAAQRAWIAEHGGGVVEGRDIGTVVAPDATLKVYLAASDEERARRRSMQDEPGTREEAFAATLDDIRRRDRLDSTRAVAPLMVADDAVVVDTTGLSPDEVVTHVVACYMERSGQARVARVGLTAGAGPSRRERAAYFVVRGTIATICRVVWRPRIAHRERLPRRGAYLMAPSHRSFLDTPFVACLTPRRMGYMGKSEMFRHPRLGRIFCYLGAFPVDRSGPDRASMRVARAVLAAGEPLVMFPEGTRRAGPRIEDLLDGVAYLALRAGVPIVPVGIGGSEKVLGRDRKFPRFSRVALVVGEPIPVTLGAAGTIRRRDVAALTERLRGELQILFDEAEILAG